MANNNFGNDPFGGNGMDDIFNSFFLEMLGMMLIPVTQLMDMS